MLRRPSISTLFPYTTLFRSQNLRLRLAGLEVAGDQADAFVGPGRAAEWIGRRRHDEGAAVRHRLELPAQQHRLDRKSTRLNSSHQIISYAVFCLKKKKNTSD